MEDSAGDCAVDCGIVVNPIAAINLVEGGSVDGIGHSMYSGLTFTEGAPDQSNFDKYRLIRHSEAPKSIDVHFVQNEIDPTGLGEPPFPPVMGALANALYKATNKRFYTQPFVKDLEISTLRMCGWKYKLVRETNRRMRGLKHGKSFLARRRRLFTQ